MTEPIQTIDLAQEHFRKITGGHKTTTIRRGRRDYQLGDTLLRSTTSELKRKVNVTRLSYIRLHDVSDTDAQRDGFANFRQLMIALLEYYPDLRTAEEMTIVYFELQ